jgi:hypothetical protein
MCCRACCLPRPTHKRGGLRPPSQRGARRLRPRTPLWDPSCMGVKSLGGQQAPSSPQLTHLCLLRIKAWLHEGRSFDDIVVELDPSIYDSAWSSLRPHSRASMMRFTACGLHMALHGGGSDSTVRPPGFSGTAQRSMQHVCIFSRWSRIAILIVLLKCCLLSILGIKHDCYHNPDHGRKK